MAEFFGSVLFTRILIAIIMVSVAGLSAIGIGSIFSKKKNKKKAKALSNTKESKEVKTEKEEEIEETIEEQIQKDEEQESNLSEFEYNGVKYVKYEYGNSQCVCKPENSSKWITFVQKLQNSGKLEKSKNNANSTLVINKEENLECFITGDNKELDVIAKESLTDYNTQLNTNEQTAVKPEVTTEQEEVKEI